MHYIVDPSKPDRASAQPISRRGLLTGGASTSLVAAALNTATLRPDDANAADPGRPVSTSEGGLPHPSGSGTGLSRRTGAVAPVQWR